MQQFILMQLQHTGVPQEFLKHAIPDYVVSGTDLSFRLSNTKKCVNSQHNSCLVWMKSKVYLFLVKLAKIYNMYFFYVLQNVSI